DTTVLITLSMAVIYIVVALFAGSSYVETHLSNGQNFIVFVMLKAATFAAGVYIILAGVQIVLDEIVPAFKGISEKLVKNARPALDAPMTFGFAPNAVLIGFLASFFGGLLGMTLMAILGTTIIIPGIVAHFMAGGAAGVFGNGQGGIRGCLTASFINGLFITFLPLFLLPVLGDLGSANSTYSDADYGVFGVILGHANIVGGRTVLISVILIALILFYSVSILMNKRDSNNFEKVEEIK
ncbi:PTS ascorbate transporter subunit IIC, partial [Bifidobacteriaceae bacterium NR016]